MLLSCLVAPLVLSAILGFAFGHGASSGRVVIGVAGAPARLVAAAAASAQLPGNVTVRPIAHDAALRTQVSDGVLAGGVIRTAHRPTRRDLLVPLVAPGAHAPGFTVVSRSSSLSGQAWAEAVAAGLAGRLYAQRLQGGDGDGLRPARLGIRTVTLGNASRGVLNYFAPSIAVVFLFIGGGLGLRSLMLERAGGTLARLAAAPVRAGRIVAGKLLAIFLTALTSILMVWGVTTAAFGAHWGAPLGVLLLAIGASASMCGLGVFLTSLARNEQEAFGVALMVGLLLALIGGNLLPPGALPSFLQVLSLGTPNGWALVGFGRLALLGEPASAAVGPFVMLALIAAVTTALAFLRVRNLVRL